MAKEKTLGLNRKLTTDESCNLDRTLAVIIYPILLKFQKTTNCWPSGFNSLKEWKKTLSKMVFSFREIAKNLKNRPLSSDSKKYEKYNKKINKGLKLFYKHYFRL